MKELKKIEFAILTLLAVLGLAGTFFFSNYARLAMETQKNKIAVSQPKTKVAVAEKKPTVLGAETVVGQDDNAGINTTTDGSGNWQAAKNTPSKINKLYDQHCSRPANLEEMDKWLTKTINELETALTGNPLVYCQ